MDNVSESQFLSPVKQMTQEEYKLRAMQKRNAESAAQIESFMENVENNGFDSLDEDTIQKFKKIFDGMKDDTPLKTKKRKADDILNLAFNQQYQDLDIVANNRNRLQDIQSSKKKVLVATTVLGAYASPDKRRRVSAVDVDHVIQPEVFFDVDISSDQKILKAINGGHVFKSYVEQNLIQHNEGMFLDSKGVILGIDFGKDSQGNPLKKTVHVSLTEEEIIQIFLHSTTIARSHSDVRFRVSMIENRPEIFGSYQDPYNELIYPTIFPMLVVNGDNVDQDGMIYIGQFVTLNKDNLLDVDMYHDYKFYISLEDFKIIMSKARLFKSEFNTINFADITSELENFFKDQLQDLGKDHFPCHIYGRLDLGL